jgi:hypothetical protein
MICQSGERVPGDDVIITNVGNYLRACTLDHGVKDGHKFCFACCFPTKGWAQGRLGLECSVTSRLCKGLLRLLIQFQQSWL